MLSGGLAWGEFLDVELEPQAWKGAAAIYDTRAIRTDAEDARAVLRALATHAELPTGGLDPHPTAKDFDTDSRRAYRCDVETDRSIDAYANRGALGIDGHTLLAGGLDSGAGVASGAHRGADGRVGVDPDFSLRLDAGVGLAEGVALALLPAPLARASAVSAVDSP